MVHSPVRATCKHGSNLQAIVHEACVFPKIRVEPDFENDPWANGPYCYLLANATWFPTPILCPGNQNLFGLPGNLVTRVEEQLSKPSRTLTGIDNLLRALRPTEAEVLWMRASDAYEDGRLADSKEYLDRLETKSPNDAQIYPFRAEINWELLDHRNALADFDKAIALDPSKVAARLRKGVLLEDMGFLDEALRCYQETLAGDENNADAFSCRAQIKVKLKDYDAAFRDFTRAIELAPEDADNYSRRGFLHFMLGHEELANHDFRKARGLIEAQGSTDPANPGE